jgi:hypothetical protein
VSNLAQNSYRSKESALAWAVHDSTRSICVGASNSHGRRLLIVEGDNLVSEGVESVRARRDAEMEALRSAFVARGSLGLSGELRSSLNESGPDALA